MSDSAYVEMVARITKESPRAFWLKFDDGEIFCVPKSVIADNSPIWGASDRELVRIESWWWNQPKRMMRSQTANPDNHLKLVSDSTGEEMPVAKVKCVGCGLINDGLAQLCFHCSRNPRTGEL